MTVQPDPQLDIIRKLIKQNNALARRVEALESAQPVTMIIKTTTGDPVAGFTGQLVNNTFDNNLKAWLEGAWRTLVAY